VNGKYIEFFIEDTGCGIDEASKEFIFKPFYTGKKPNIGNKGFGLGLAISQGLVRLLGGELHFNSEAGKGSRFFFNIESRISVDQPDAGKIGKFGDAWLTENWSRWNNNS
jgi:signal transduction histidine kinase